MNPLTADRHELLSPTFHMLISAATLCLLKALSPTTLSGQVAFVHFLPDGKRLVVGRGPITGNGQVVGRIEITDVRGKVVRTLAENVGINSAALSPDGKTLATSRGDRDPLELRDLKTGALVRRFESGIQSYPQYEFFANGKGIVFIASALLTEYGHLEAQTCTLKDGQPTKLIASDGASRIAVDPAGKWIAVVTSRTQTLSNQFPKPFDYRIQIYNASNGSLEQSIPSALRVAGMSFSPTGSRLIVRQQDGKIEFRDTTTWQVTRALVSQSVPEGFGFDPATIIESKDAQTLLVSLEGLGVAIYDLRLKGKPRISYAAPRTLWRSVDLSPDGKTFALGTTDGTIELRSIKDGRLLPGRTD